MRLLIAIEVCVLMAMLLGFDGGDPHHKDRPDVRTRWDV